MVQTQSITSIDNKLGQIVTFTRVPITGFLVFGLLTVWIYTAIKFPKVLFQHFYKSHTAIKSFHSPEFDVESYKDLYQTMLRQGFYINTWFKWILVSGYVLVAILIVALFYILVIKGPIESDKMVIWSIGTVSLIFYANSLAFFLWTHTRIKNHEYYEIQFCRFVQNPNNFKMHEPSNDYVSRWEKKDNHLALFLIITFALAISPIFGAIAMRSSPSTPIWMISVYGSLCAYGIYHIWGCRLLVNLFNDHLTSGIHKHEIDLYENDKYDITNNKKTSDETGQVPTRELAVIMMTDIVGYSRRMELDEDLGYQLLLTHNKIIRAKLTNYSGHEIKTIGDAFLVIFKSAIDAVKCALAIQNAFAEYNKGQNKKNQLLVRIGIHMGDIIFSGGDVYGDGVNVTSRIETLATPGGICVSEEVYNVIRKRLHIDAEVIEHKELKNISIAPVIYKLEVPIETPDI